MNVVIQNNINQVRNQLTQRQRLALRKVAEFIEGQAKLNCPVLTGNLRSSITNSVSSDSAKVGTNVVYSEVVHEGGLRHKAQPFLEDAVIDNQIQIEALLKEAFNL